ncbi:MAG: hypothetical protein BYD32DRAFT_408334 [Podila humilis]|nr:MAG: hypothetical protein BYD32DRAFT_408334 [Podila humilis]
MDAILTDSALFELLASFLPSNSLAACARVNKHWNARWTPYLYRHIRFDNIRQVLCFHGYNNILSPTPVDTVPTGKDFHAWIKHAVPTGLKKHGHHIRSLSTSQLSVLDPLVQTGTCTNLSSLRISLRGTCMTKWSQPGLHALNIYCLPSQLRMLNNLAVDPADPTESHDLALPMIMYSNGAHHIDPVRNRLTTDKPPLSLTQRRRWGNRYQHSTHYIGVNRHPDPWSLSGEGPNCKNLLIALLGLNPGLRELAITDSFPFHHSQVLRAIGNLPKLKELYLFSSLDTKVDESAVRYLLRKCQPHLEKMVVSLTYGGPLEPEFEEDDEKEVDTEDEEKGEDNWDVVSTTSEAMDIDDNSNKDKKKISARNNLKKKSSAALRELLLEGDMHGHEGPVWTPFLSECSRLERLSIGVFSESFLGPLARSLRQAQSVHLCDLELGYVHMPSSLLDSDLARLLALASQPGWKRIRLTHFSGFGQRSMGELMKHTSTLEHLTIQFCDSILIGPMVTAIMTKFHKLKHLQIEFDSNSQNAECDAGISAKTIAEGEQWVCDQLEYLMVQIKGVPRPDLLEPVNPVNSGSATSSAPQPPPGTTTSTTTATTTTVHCPSMEELEEESQNLQQCIYEQLGYLTELRELHLTSNSNSDRSSTSTSTSIMSQFRDGSFSYVHPIPFAAPKSQMVNNNGQIMEMIKQPRQYQREQSDSLALSIDTGLVLMMRLKKLEVLNVTGMRHQLGIPELEWMSEHWTALKEIKGLFWENDQVDFLKFKHPDMLHFLKQKTKWRYSGFVDFPV